MVDYLKAANKLVECVHGHRFNISTNEIVATCPVCGEKVAFYSLGTIAGKFH